MIEKWHLRELQRQALSEPMHRADGDLGFRRIPPDALVAISVNA